MGTCTMTAKKTNKNLNIYRIIGKFSKEKNTHKFTKEIMVPNKRKAEEQIFSIMGSKHRVKRREITIEKIEEISPEKVTDPIIKQIIGGK